MVLSTINIAIWYLRFTRHWILTHREVKSTVTKIQQRIQNLLTKKFGFPCGSIVDVPLLRSDYNILDRYHSSHMAANWIMSLLWCKGAEKQNYRFYGGNKSQTVTFCTLEVTKSFKLLQHRLYMNWSRFFRYNERNYSLLVNQRHLWPLSIASKW